MKIREISISSIKSFDDLRIEFSPTLNILVGANNSGKSTIIKCAGALQEPLIRKEQFDRINQTDGAIELKFDTGVDYFGQEISEVRIESPEYKPKIILYGGSTIPEYVIPAKEPDNFVIPYYSNRKVAGYNEAVRTHEVSRVTGTLENLYSKIDRISNPDATGYGRYTAACKEIFGFGIYSTISANGKKGTYTIQDEKIISIDVMGDGTANILGLIIELVRASGKLFLIEEPENDIHPKALKVLLDLVIESSKNNQFIISTHSAYVVRYLCAEQAAKLFEISMSLQDKIPTSQVKLIDSMEDRLLALESLGYEQYELGFWDGWLFFEESSAERICREFLIPWFASKLNGRLRTFSVSGIDQLTTKFVDFNNLFVFLHLTPVYKNKAWVIVDGGEHEMKILSDLRNTYTKSGWSPNNFIQLSRHDFESYYPKAFKEDADAILAIADKRARQEAKRKLLNRVIDWAKKDQELARQELFSSAKELIDILRKIEDDIT